MKGSRKPKPVAPAIPKADAYGGVLVNAHRQVLLREPTNHFGSYVWTFAKGRPDKGESADQAALREVREETGYAAGILAAIPEVFGGTTSTTAFFLMEPVGGQGAFSDETSQTRWVGFEEAQELIGQTTTATGRKRDLAVLKAAKEILDALGPAARPAARREDGGTLSPMPERRASIALDLRFDAAAMALIRKGYIPWNDVWFAYFDHDTLYWHRAASGCCIFEVRFAWDQTGGRVVEAIASRDPWEYGKTDDEEDRRFIAWLIDYLLVTRSAESGEDGLVTGLKLATQPNYLGSPDVVAALVGKLFDVTVRQHAGKAGYQDGLAATDEICKALTTDDAGYTRMPGWHTGDQLGRALVRYLDLDADCFAGENLYCLCSESLTGVSLKIREMLKAFEVDPLAQWEPHGASQLRGLHHFVTTVLMGTNVVEYPGKFLRDFQWEPVCPVTGT